MSTNASEAFWKRLETVKMLWLAKKKSTGAPKGAKKAPRRLPGDPKEAPGDPNEAPKGPQSHPKRTPETLKFVKIA